MTMGKRKLTTLDHRAKREICRHKQQNPEMTNRKLRAWAEEKFECKVHEATICRLLKKSSTLLSNVTSDEVKRRKTPRCPAVEEALYKWFLTAQEDGSAITDELIVEKGKELYDFELKQNPDQKVCKFSNGWLAGFKKRRNIKQSKLHGEADPAAETQT